MALNLKDWGLARSMSKRDTIAAPGEPVAAGEAILTMPDGSIIKLPVLKDSFGDKFVDIRKLQPSHGICTFDPGFTSTASCQSSITYIDGNAGCLLYRGYPIEEIAAKGDFIDASFLLLHGELPSQIEKAAFDRELRMHTLVPEQLIQFFKGFKHDAHPMAILCGVVGALSSFYPEVSDVRDSAQQLRACYRMIAKMPTLAAIAYKTSIGQPIIYPRNDLTFTENFLYMMFAVPCEKYEVDKDLAKALEIIFILHLDHEQNASTSTVRTAGSSQANPFACVASGIAALWGPAHGGANEAVLTMLEEIDAMGGVPAIPKVLERARDKTDPFRLMGFGHRVYKTHDPRAKLMREVTHGVLAKLGRPDPLLGIAMELEKAALEDEYFITRHLYPNVDFYSGIVLRALGVPVSMYTVLFAMARSVGWMSQWKEMVREPVNRISRPRQIFTGYRTRRFVPVEKRLHSGQDTLTPSARKAMAAKIATGRSSIDEENSNGSGEGNSNASTPSGATTPKAMLMRAVTTHYRNAMS